MNSIRLADWAAASCRRWVRLYTRRLDDGPRDRRRAEIESDLYEHRAEAIAAGATGHRLAAEILGRVLVGMPADLSWRRAYRQPRERPTTGGTAMPLSPRSANRAINILGGIVVVYVWGFVFSGLIYLTVTGELVADGRLAFMIVPFAASLIMLAGLKTRLTNPRRGLHLIAVALIGPCIWFWFLPFYGPLAIATLVVAITNTPRKDQPAIVAA